MVRADKIKALLQEKVVPLMDLKLKQYGFTYQKSKGIFSREKNGFKHIIGPSTHHSPFVFDEDKDQLHYIFTIASTIEIIGFDEWYLSTFGEKTRFYYNTDKITSKIELSSNDFSSENFYEPTASQNFKRNVTLSMAGGMNLNDIIPINDALNSSLPNMVSNLSNNSGILELYKKRQYPFQYQYIEMLFFGGFVETAKGEYQKYYQTLLNEIESKMKVSETEAKGKIEELTRLVRTTQKITDLALSNPYSLSIKIAETKNDFFEFSPITRFSEVLRLDVSSFEINSVNINSKGEILIFANKKRIIKLASDGQIIFEKELETKKGFNIITWYVPAGIITGSDHFFVNNYIIRNDNTILELPLPIQKLKKGNLQNPGISDFAFHDKANKYLIVYEDQLITYDIDGQLERSMDLGQKSKGKIIVEKEWIITQRGDKENVIIDFEGNIIGTYAFGNGNTLFEFSDSYDQLICFFYSTKSQFYDLTNEKKGTLWAHPTFIKDYKEIMYNDTELNFGMTIARFSPDHTYIVGGAYHGKYVAWTLPKLDRIELMPLQEVIDALEPVRFSNFSNPQQGEKIVRAEKIILENQTFLKNRMNPMSKIIFFENGDIFITEIGPAKFVLTWDRNFRNQNYKKIEGSIDLHSGKYLTQRTKHELIVYKEV